VVSHLTEFDGKQLVSVAKGGLDLGKLEDEAEKKEQESAAGEFKELTEKIARSLGERAKEVRVTHRLTDSPACLVADEHDVSGNLARILKAAGQKAPSSPSSKSTRATRWCCASSTKRRSSTTGARCCSTRPCSPKAASSTTRRPSSSA
jgi:HSP90 family molecular chaperone